jgi:anti-anti-sigma factor
VDDVSYSSSFDEASSTLTLSGEIDEAAGVVLREEISKYSRDFARPLRIDLSAVDYFPSLAVGVLATAMRRADQNGVGLGLVAAEGSVAQRVLTICNLEHETA